jgi:hypothetical protein
MARTMQWSEGITPVTIDVVGSWSRTVFQGDQLAPLGDPDAGIVGIEVGAVARHQRRASAGQIGYPRRSVPVWTRR